jgi:hypothetical protein
MISERKLRRFQFSLLLAAGALFAFYWFAYRSVSGWARDLDKPAADAWKRLITAAQNVSMVRALDARALQAGVLQMQLSAGLLRQAAASAGTRIGLDAETQARLKDEFQLLEYDRSRLQVGAGLKGEAAKRKVVLAEPAVSGLPEFDPNLSQPSLLWAQLAFARQLVATALAAQPRAVSNLTMLPIVTHVAGESRQPVLHQFRMRLELFGPTASAVKFLRGLPLTGGEFAAAGLAEPPGKAQPLFVDHLLLKNVSAIPEETSLEVVVTAFCKPPATEGAR